MAYFVAVMVSNHNCCIVIIRQRKIFLLNNRQPIRSKSFVYIATSYVIIIESVLHANIISLAVRIGFFAELQDGYGRFLNTAIRSCWRIDYRFTEDKNSIEQPSVSRSPSSDCNHVASARNVSGRFFCALTAVSCTIYDVGWITEIPVFV